MPTALHAAPRWERKSFMLQLVSRFRDEVRPTAQTANPKPELVEVTVDDRCRIQSKELTQKQAADDRNSQRPTQLRAIAEAERKRDRAEHGCHRRHHDGPE